MTPGVQRGPRSVIRERVLAEGQDPKQWKFELQVHAMHPACRTAVRRPGSEMNDVSLGVRGSGRCGLQ